MTALRTDFCMSEGMRSRFSYADATNSKSTSESVDPGKPHLQSSQSELGQGKAQPVEPGRWGSFLEHLKTVLMSWKELKVETKKVVTTSQLSPSTAFRISSLHSRC